MSVDPAIRVGNQDVPTKSISFKLVIETGVGGEADMVKVEELISLHIQDLLFDETFAEALQPREFISSTVTKLDKQIG